MDERLKYTLTEILEATGGRLLLRGADHFTGLSIDSRTIKPGELFIALRGERFDGHNFVNDALQKANGAVVSYPPAIPVKGKSIIHVNNTLKALQGIARYRRLSRYVTVIGVTGTNGKTTTKEMISAVLKMRYRVLTSRGNLNNHIGVPLNLSMLDGQEIAVLEMGASQPGDINELCKIARPDIGVVTNIGPGHLAGFGSLETVRDTKLEIAGFVKRLILNNDDNMLRPEVTLIKKNGVDVVTFGISGSADVRATDIRRTDSGISFRLHCGSTTGVEVELPMLGLFNVYNALAAASVSMLFSISEDYIVKALSEFKGVPMRVERRQFRGALVISDLYNANPASMEEAIKELVSLRKNRAIAVLGDMLELGAYEETAHRKIGQMLAELPVDVLVAVGQMMEYAAEEFLSISKSNKQCFIVQTPEEARRVLDSIVKDGDTVLIKGSRGMKLERILEE